MVQNTEVGLIKFTPDTNELANNKIFYLSKVSTFLNSSQKPNDKINDPDEGYAYLMNGEKISYKDIIKHYSGMCQSYISCFTILYDSDFDENGKIKKCVANCIKESNNLGTKRDAVIFNLQPKYNMLNTLDRMAHNTVEFINRDIKKPLIGEDGVQLFPTMNSFKFCEDLKREDLNLALSFCSNISKGGFPRHFNKDMLAYLKRKGLLEEENKKTDVTLTANKIVYNPGKIRFEDKEHFFDHLQTGEVTTNEMNKYLKICLGEKDDQYSDQHEYRLLVTEFGGTNTFPCAIKLLTPDNTQPWWAKIKKYNEVDCLTISDFKESDGNLGTEKIKYTP
ncbi:hypothetical protein FCF15_11130 [Lentilactobacillus buchneri]|uniref:hypothetical protein n=1 Tax=Lentilactobacillus buchneri TaxID=1581 RepID=UPI0010ABBD86|nr:hypothetical protein [Lentilactobacillus buchneri]TJY08510.1 hypothetical protein FCF15_11130 [Lentilactobacillus buchneri]